MRTKNVVTLVRMQCSRCKSMLACDFDCRRDQMICPVCANKSALTYVPPAEPYTIPLNNLPVASPLKKKRFYNSSLFTIPAVFLSGFLSCVIVYALGHGEQIDKHAKSIVNWNHPEEKRSPKTEAPSPPPPAAVAHPDAPSVYQRGYGHYVFKVIAYPEGQSRDVTVTADSQHHARKKISEMAESQSFTVISDVIDYRKPPSNYRSGAGQ